ncbi:probable palmitoyltransferase zdhhc14-like [Lichtheimia corymbifera JMRC:FSU:9682]|uniref:Palmitoyltransferase n=1 Tax=Lichtheimia corymbifera JMRC:FSU:9682 TaxID=1263082 RepID=A0A068RMK8_9FUNG|nr:probable palmitoyltransferase zdhhc14-like [Lichtheimia corymbifera JMRC:FSU:9682]
MEQNERQPMHATSLSDDHGEVKYKAATFSSIGVPLSEHPATEQHNFATIGQQHHQQGHLLTPAPFSHPSSSIIRFAASDLSYQPDSLETFDFNAIPSSETTKAIPNHHHHDQQQQQQHTREQLRQRTLTDESSSIQTSMNQPSSSHEIPHSSGMTTLSNMTSDDSTTLIGQGRSNTYHPPSVSVATHPPHPPHHPPALSADASRDARSNTTTRHSLNRPSNPPLSPPPPSSSSSPSPPHNTRPSTDGPGPSNSMIPMDTLTRGKTVDLAKKSTVRNYQMFPGRNKFFCGGRLMTSREYWAFLLALVLLIGPSVLFGIFTCPFIWEHIHPAIPIVFAYLFLLSLASMIKTSWTDPGIIPRDLDPFPAMDQPYDDHGSAYGSMWHQGFPTQKQVQIKDNTWTLRYCETCRIYRPPRASHCRQCDNCVETEDHHCIWLNNCIGKRNYRPFFVFITTATLLCLFVIAFSAVHLILIYRDSQDDTSFSAVFNAAPVSFVLAIVCFVLLLMVGGLTLYHCSLILRGITTHEQLRASIMNTKYPSANPYNRGNPVLNMAQVLCRPRPKSYLRRRKFVETEKLYAEQKPSK